MPTTLDEVVVRFGAQGAADIEGASAASAAAIARVPAAAEGAAIRLEAVQARLQHVSVASAFAFTSLAEGGERGLTRLAHSVAFLGDAFGPLGLAVTTFVAVGGEQLLEWFHKSQSEAEKTSEKFLSEIGDLANKAKVDGLMAKLKSISFGEPFDDKGQIRKVAGTIVSAGQTVNVFEGSLADLETQWDALMAKVPEGASMIDGDLATAVDRLRPKLDIARTQFAQIRDAIAAVQSQAASPSLEALSKMFGTNVTETAFRLLPEGYESDAGKQIDAAFELWKKGLEKTNVERRKADSEWKRDELKTDDENATAQREYFRKVSAENKAFTEEQKRAAEERQRATDAEAKATVRMVDQIVGAFASRSPAAAIKKFAAQMLSGLAEMILEQSSIYEVYGQIMAALSDALTDPFTAGPAAIAIGVALAALGAALSASASSSGGGGGSTSYGGGYGVAATPYTTVGANVPTSTGAAGTPSSTSPLSSPSTMQPISQHFTIIGQNDPAAQRQLAEMAAKGARRGTTSGN